MPVIETSCGQRKGRSITSGCSTHRLSQPVIQSGGEHSWLFLVTNTFQVSGGKPVEVRRPAFDTSPGSQQHRETKHTSTSTEARGHYAQPAAHESRVNLQSIHRTGKTAWTPTIVLPPPNRNSTPRRTNVRPSTYYANRHPIRLY